MKLCILDDVIGSRGHGQAGAYRTPSSHQCYRAYVPSPLVSSLDRCLISSCHVDVIQYNIYYLILQNNIEYNLNNIYKIKILFYISERFLLW